MHRAEATAELYSDHGVIAMLKRLMAWLLAPFRKERILPGLDGMTYEELAELYESRGWPPPGKGEDVPMI